MWLGSHPCATQHEGVSVVEHTPEQLIPSGAPLLLLLLEELAPGLGRELGWGWWSSTPSWAELR